MKTIRIGISIGDINGIGLEIILKSLSHPDISSICTPIIYGSTKLVSFQKKILELNTNIIGIQNAKQAKAGKINCINLWQEVIPVNFGKLESEKGKYAIESVEAAVDDLNNGLIDALVTAPINKKNIQSQEFNFPGHTEYLESKSNGKALMLMISDSLRIGVITGHIPVQEIANSITPELIEEKIKILSQSLKKDFAIAQPKIAILGLNPHCGDDGVIGDEDQKIVVPTIEKLKKQKNLVFGPYAADSFFGKDLYTQFDGVLAMYHDQGLTPFKTLAQGRGVNYTAGLDIIRTSPDHGTAYDIAGANTAQPDSFLKALFSAIDIVKNRTLYKEYSSNPLEKTKIKVGV